MIKIISSLLTILTLMSPMLSLADNDTVELTCHTEFIDDKPSQTKTPIFWKVLKMGLDIPTQRC